MLVLIVAALAEPGIVPVLEGQTVRAEVESYLLPGPYFDRCLVQARTLEVAEASLGRCVADGTEGLAACAAALDEAHARQLQDATDLATCSGRVAVLEIAARDLRRQRNAAWGVAGGVLAVVSVGFALAL